MGLDLSSKRHFPEDNPVVKAFPSSKMAFCEDNSIETVIPGDFHSERQGMGHNWQEVIP